MSVDVPKTVGEAPAPITKEIPATEPVATAPTTSEVHNASTAVPTSAVDGPVTESSTQPIETPLKNDETVVEAKPTTEGVLGYKEPGFLKGLRFQRHFFWFSDEPSTPESLSSYIRQDKSEKHHNAAYARETGKGVLFYSKRVEDRVTPAGMIMLSDASNVTKEGHKEFSMKVGNHQHRFEAATSEERNSWVVAIEAKLEEAKASKEEVIGRESYKNNLKEYGTAGAAPAGLAAYRSRSRGAKKMIEPATATPVAAVEKDEANTTSPVEAVVDPATVGPLGTLEPVDNASKHSSTKKDTSRSQSRKRGSIFGNVFGKKEDRDEHNQVKKEGIVESEAIKEQKAEEKAETKAESELVRESKNEEVIETQEPSKPVEATEATAAAAAAAVPATLATTEERKTDRDEAVPTSAKTKRSSVFGGFFGRKVASPQIERSEHEGGLSNGVPPVSENAPKLDEPIESKPIDSDAVTTPAVQAPAVQAPATIEEPITEPTTTGTNVTTETPAEPTTEAEKERPAREKRRTSLFGGFGTIKRKDNAENDAEVKREKSPLPSKLSGLFRKPSRAVRNDKPVDSEKPALTTKQEALAENGAEGETKATGEVKGIDNLAATDNVAPFHEAVTTAPQEVQASA